MGLFRAMQTKSETNVVNEHKTVTVKIVSSLSVTSFKTWFVDWY